MKKVMGQEYRLLPPQDQARFAAAFHAKYEYSLLEYRSVGPLYHMGGCNRKVFPRKDGPEVSGSKDFLYTP